MKQIFLDHKFGHKIGFHHTVLQTLFMNCSILLHSLERKIKKRNFEKISNCKKIIKTLLKHFHHYYCIIFPTYYLPDCPTPLLISHPEEIFLKKIFCKKFERIFCFKATCDCEACCYDKFLKIKKITLDFC